MAIQQRLTGELRHSSRILPQLAVHMLGQDNIVRFSPADEGYSGRVWRVLLTSGDRCIVKQCLNLWCSWNELTALEYLEFLGLDHSRLIDTSGRILIFEDRDLGPVHFPTEIGMRKIGWTLRALHDGRYQIDSDQRDTSYLLPAITELATKRGYSPVQSRPTHGDVGPSNTVSTPASELLYFIDFEEFGPGDPLADLMVACVEFMVHHPALARMILRSLEQAYFVPNVVDDRFNTWRNPSQRLILAEATLKILKAWAPRFQQHEMVEVYNRYGERILTTLNDSSLD